MHGIDTHTWKQPRETSRTSHVTHTLRTRTGYAHMETGLNSPIYKLEVYFIINVNVNSGNSPQMVALRRSRGMDQSTQHFNVGCDNKERILRRMSSPCFTHSNDNKQRRLADDV